MYNLIKAFNLYVFAASAGFLIGTVFGNATIGTVVGIFVLSLMILFIQFKD